MNAHLNQKNITVYQEILSRCKRLSTEIADLANILELSSHMKDEIEELLLTLEYIAKQKLDEQAEHDTPGSQAQASDTTDDNRTNNVDSEQEGYSQGDSSHKTSNFITHIRSIFNSLKNQVITVIAHISQYHAKIPYVNTYGVFACRQP